MSFHDRRQFSYPSRPRIDLCKGPQLVKVGLCFPTGLKQDRQHPVKSSEIPIEAVFDKINSEL